MLNKLTRLAKLSWVVIKSEGVGKFIKLSSRKVYYRLFPHSKPRYMRDVLFVAGSRLSQVERYRVNHQIEQLRGNGMTADIAYEHIISDEDIKYYRGFVFCRYPYTPKTEEFIKKAKSFNKTIIFEIDDLVFDTDFTDNIATVQRMNKADRELYDSGVKRSQQTLRLCDYAITTTEPLSEELKKYKNIKNVFVNRNVASDEMVALSQKAVKEITKGFTDFRGGENSPHETISVNNKSQTHAEIASKLNNHHVIVKHNGKVIATLHPLDNAARADFHANDGEGKEHRVERTEKWRSKTYQKHGRRFGGDLHTRQYNQLSPRLLDV